MTTFADQFIPKYPAEDIDNLGKTIRNEIDQLKTIFEKEIEISKKRERSITTHGRQMAEIGRQGANELAIDMVESMAFRLSRKLDIEI